MTLQEARTLIDARHFWTYDALKNGTPINRVKDGGGTNDTKQFADVFLSSFCLGYRNATCLYQENPYLYKNTSKEPKDFQMSLILEMADRWYQMAIEKKEPPEKIKYTLRGKRQQKKPRPHKEW